MDLELKDKITLITGSSRGIGLNIANYLSSIGCKVVLNGRDKTRLDKAVASISTSIGIAADVSQPKSAKALINQVIEKFGRLDLLVCNVGGGRSVPPGEETPDEWLRVFAKNLWSVTNVVETAKKPLIQSKGSIVCISSICGLEVIPGAPITYSTAKAALNLYVKGISRPLGQSGVRINAIAPGNFVFDGSVWEEKILDDPIYVSENIKNNVSLNKLGDPKDLGKLTAYLLSPNANFVTGSIWTIDGGQIRG